MEYEQKNHNQSPASFTLQRLLQWVANEGLEPTQCHQTNKDFKTNTAVLREDKIEFIVNQPDNVQIRTKILLAPSSLARLWQVYQPMATHWVASSRSKGAKETQKSANTKDKKALLYKMLACP